METSLFFDTEPFKEALLSVKSRSNQRLLGLDIGEKTIGLALSDWEYMIATSLKTLRREKFSLTMIELKKIIQDHDVMGLVVGYPLNMNGTQGPRCQSVTDFCKNFIQQMPMPILLWDERLSTVAVTNMMIEADLSRKRRAELVDKLAASYILQGALDRFKLKDFLSKGMKE